MQIMTFQGLRLRTEQLLRRYAAALSPSTVRFHAVALGAGIWIAAVVTLSSRGPFDRHGLLKGMDFFQFHAAGRMIAEGRARELYDWAAFAGCGAAHGAGHRGPSVSLCVPTATGAVVRAVWPARIRFRAWVVDRLQRGTLCLLRVGADGCLARVPASALDVVAGRRRIHPFSTASGARAIAALVLVCFTCAWLALRRDSSWWFGAALGSLAFKPQFAAAAVLAVLVSRNGRVAIGAAGAAVLQGAVAVLWLGVLPFEEYLLKVPVILQSAALFEPKLWQMHNLKGFCGLLVGTGILGTLAAGTLSVVVVYFVYATWRDTNSG